MAVRYVIYAMDVEADTPAQVQLVLKSGAVVNDTVAREFMTADQFRGMNPVAVHREMLRCLGLDEMPMVPLSPDPEPELDTDPDMPPAFEAGDPGPTPEPLGAMDDWR